MILLFNISVFCKPSIATVALSRHFQSISRLPRAFPLLSHSLNAILGSDDIPVDTADAPVVTYSCSLSQLSSIAARSYSLSRRFPILRSPLVAPSSASSELGFTKLQLGGYQRFPRPPLGPRENEFGEAT
ncbi:hypothetical protein CRG98_035578 [Punica granatum]|uniref:Uncharacterized protein n=1 Tax=Punica granatum TaxID=22663 RepID=A0A2I0IJ59_PUNGR|nr:hypothetical protein CRG98_035578 [Punica granatum]